MKHYSVLLEESIEALQLHDGGTYVDGTLGRGGHSSLILKYLHNGHLYAFDRDQKAIDESMLRLKEIGSNFTLIHANFSCLKRELNKYGIHEIDGMVLDLGVSSPQFDEAERGFSYRYDAPLDMRMDQSQSLDAKTIVNTWDYHDLVKIFFQYGEDKFSKQIARKIEQRRVEKPIETTFELVDIIRSALPSKVLNSKGHPAKKIFQAIRIAVNDELQELRLVLEDALSLLSVNGRLAVISFHSLEDRIVKECFHSYASVPKVDKRIPLLPSQIEEAPYRLINKKVILPSAQELEENNRSHSAKLRIIERIR